jgi:hypothetical protein
MTAARQERKSRRLHWLWRVVFGAAIVGTCLGPVSIGAATTEVIVVNHHTGLALSGYDPVAYFIDGKAEVGRPELEMRVAGATWRFRNEGNRAAFGDDPEVYIPQFGGYDPVAVARGASAPGHPEVWLVFDRRLYLFRNDNARRVFAENPGHVLDAAADRWPDVLRTLTP